MATINAGAFDGRLCVAYLLGSKGVPFATCMILDSIDSGHSVSYIVRHE
jgi:hypothetical protein